VISEGLFLLMDSVVRDYFGDCSVWAERAPSGTPHCGPDSGGLRLHRSRCSTSSVARTQSVSPEIGTTPP